MNRLKFIVRETNKLLKRTYNLLTFDALGNTELLEVVCEVLHRVEAGPMTVKAEQDPVLTILTALQAVKYEPPDKATPADFYDSVLAADTDVIYPIIQWLLINQHKIKKRAYLARYATKIPMPQDLTDDVEVKNAFKKHQHLIDDFWITYKESTSFKKVYLEAVELKNDIKKMNQDLNNIMTRTQAQGEKINNIPNKENLIFVGRTYRQACVEQRNLIQQLKDNVELLSRLEYQVKNMEAKWSRLGSQPLSEVNISSLLEEECRVNKIFFETKLPQEMEVQTDFLEILGKCMDNSCPSNEVLMQLVKEGKDDVQKLLNEKLNLHATTEDKLGPFRKQANAISQKKIELSNEITEAKTEITSIDENIREKEVAVFNAVGGEILHGEELKHFVAMLRDKSNVYKQLRAELQSLSTELGVDNRTVDVLKSIDPTIDNAFFNASITEPEEVQANTSWRTLVEAKQVCKEIMQEIDVTKIDISRVHQQLLSLKQESEIINTNIEAIKETFDKATLKIVNEIQQLKGKIQEYKTETGNLENTWKTITQNLDKSEYIFNRLIDELIVEDGDGVVADPDNTVYLNKMVQKRDEQQKKLEEIEVSVKEMEESKKLEQEIIEFFKHTEYLISKKLDLN